MNEASQNKTKKEENSAVLAQEATLLIMKWKLSQ